MTKNTTAPTTTSTTTSTTTMMPRRATAPNKVLVHAANGVQGGAIVRRLRAEGFDVTAGVRDVARGTALRASGVEVVAAPMESRAALTEASRGVDAVVLTVPLDWDRDTVLRWTENAVVAARDAAVGLLILNSGTRLPERPTDVPSFELRRELISLARSLGPRSIVLRPPFFMENLLSPFIAGSMAKDGVLPYPIPERLSVEWLSVDDLGGYVAAALRRPELAGGAFDVSGPEPLEGEALARSLSPALGRPLRYVALSPEEMERSLAASLGPAIARGIASGYAWIAAHADPALFTGTSAELRATLARPPLSVAAWARSHDWR